MNLHNNKIGNHGAEKLADALKYNNTINRPSLWRNLKLNLSLVAMKDEESADKDKAIVMKQDRIVAQKDEEIASLKELLLNSKPTIDTVDLTADDSELNNNKRPRIDDSPKKSLESILLDAKSQKLVQVKQEKIATETALEDTKEDLEDTREKFGNQVLSVNFLQGKIDELAELAEAAGADRSKIAEIKGRLYSSR